MMRTVIEEGSEAPMDPVPTTTSKGGWRKNIMNRKGSMGHSTSSAGADAVSVSSSSTASMNTNKNNKHGNSSGRSAKSVKSVKFSITSKGSRGGRHNSSFDWHKEIQAAVQTNKWGNMRGILSLHEPQQQQQQSNAKNNKLQRLDSMASTSTSASLQLLHMQQKQEQSVAAAAAADASVSSNTVNTTNSKGKGKRRPLWKRLSSWRAGDKDSGGSGGGGAHGLDKLDPEGRTPLHVALTSKQAPTDCLLQLIKTYPAAATVANARGRLPLHFAVVHLHDLQVISALVEAHPAGLSHADCKGQSPLGYAMDWAKRETDLRQAPRCFWMPVPDDCQEAAWQEVQMDRWSVVHWLLLALATHPQTSLTVMQHQAQKPMLVDALLFAAPPAVVSLLLGASAMLLSFENRATAFAASTLYTCITRHYPETILQSLSAQCPRDVRTVRDETGMGLVSAQFISGCFEQVPGTQEWEVSPEFFSALKDSITAGVLDDYDPAFVEWWDKIEYLIAFCSGQEHPQYDGGIDDFDHEYLLHVALSNSDIPPAVIRLLLALYPDSIWRRDVKTGCLPIHLAAVTTEYIPRNYEMQIMVEDSILETVYRADTTAARKRLHHRLPLHMAIDAGKLIMSLEPFVEHDPSCLLDRDPVTGLYPWQQVAAYQHDLQRDAFSCACIARNKYSHAVWRGLSDRQRAAAVSRVVEAAEVERLWTIFELLRKNTSAIYPPSGGEAKPTSSSATSRSNNHHRTTAGGTSGNDESTGLGMVAAHYIAWCYKKPTSTTIDSNGHSNNHNPNETTIQQTTRIPDAEHLELLGRAMRFGTPLLASDGNLSTLSVDLDKWWNKLKFWIRYCYPGSEALAAFHDGHNANAYDNIVMDASEHTESTMLPHEQDRFLLHAACCNSDTPPAIIKLLLALSPESVSLPVPRTSHLPLHIIAQTMPYIAQPYEISSTSSHASSSSQLLSSHNAGSSATTSKSSLELIVRAFPRAVRVKAQNGRLPLHLAVVAGKTWHEGLSLILEQEPRALSVRDKVTGFYPFQLATLRRALLPEHRLRFLNIARRNLQQRRREQQQRDDRDDDDPREIIKEYKRVERTNRLAVLSTVFQLLRRNPGLAVKTRRRSRRASTTTRRKKSLDNTLANLSSSATAGGGGGAKAAETARTSKMPLVGVTETHGGSDESDEDSETDDDDEEESVQVMDLESATTGPREEETSTGIDESEQSPMSEVHAYIPQPTPLMRLLSRGGGGSKTEQQIQEDGELFECDASVFSGLDVMSALSSTIHHQSTSDLRQSYLRSRSQTSVLSPTADDSEMYGQSEASESSYTHDGPGFDESFDYGQNSIMLLDGSARFTEHEDTFAEDSMILDGTNHADYYYDNEDEEDPSGRARGYYYGGNEPSTYHSSAHSATGHSSSRRSSGHSSASGGQQSVSQTSGGSGYDYPADHHGDDGSPVVQVESDAESEESVVFFKLRRKPRSRFYEEQDYALVNAVKLTQKPGGGGTTGGSQKALMDQQGDGGQGGGEPMPDHSQSSGTPTNVSSDYTSLPSTLEDSIGQSSQSSYSSLIQQDLTKSRKGMLWVSKDLIESSAKLLGESHASLALDNNMLLDNDRVDNTGPEVSPKAGGRGTAAAAGAKDATASLQFSPETSPTANSPHSNGNKNSTNHHSPTTTTTTTKKGKGAPPPRGGAEHQQQQRRKTEAEIAHEELLLQTLHFSPEPSSKVRDDEDHEKLTVNLAAGESGQITAPPLAIDSDDNSSSSNKSGSSRLFVDGDDDDDNESSESDRSPTMVGPQENDNDDDDDLGLSNNSTTNNTTTSNSQDDDDSDDSDEEEEEQEEQDEQDEQDLAASVNNIVEPEASSDNVDKRSKGKPDDTTVLVDQEANSKNIANGDAMLTAPTSKATTNSTEETHVVGSVTFSTNHSNDPTTPNGTSTALGEEMTYFDKTTMTWKTRATITSKEGSRRDTSKEGSQREATFSSSTREKAAAGADSSEESPKDAEAEDTSASKSEQVDEGVCQQQATNSSRSDETDVHVREQVGQQVVPEDPEKAIAESSESSTPQTSSSAPETPSPPAKAWAAGQAAGASFQAAKGGDAAAGSPLRSQVGKAADAMTGKTAPKSPIDSGTASWLKAIAEAKSESASRRSSPDAPAKGTAPRLLTPPRPKRAAGNKKFSSPKTLMEERLKQQRYAQQAEENERLYQSLSALQVNMSHLENSTTSLAAFARSPRSPRGRRTVGRSPMMTRSPVLYSISGDHTLTATLSPRNTSPRKTVSRSNFLTMGDRSASPGGSDLQRNLSCLLCGKEKREVLMLPCRHLCLCRGCSSESNKQGEKLQCPLCQNQVTDRMLLF